MRQSGGLVVANEITTGFGRTGAWFGYENYGIRPDIVAMGKGMGNGFPVSAVAMTGAVAEQLEQDAGFRYAQSHQNDALGCAIASEVIKVMRACSLVERSATVGDLLKAHLQMLAREHSCIVEVRGRGLMLVVEFDTSVDLASIQRQLFEQGFLVGYSPSVRLLRFFPPLVMPVEDCVDMVMALGQVLDRAKM